MTTHHDDDRELEAFLRGEDDLSSLLRQAPPPEVPPELDARILAQARAALAEPAPAGREAANDPAPAPWLLRMRVPLGLAATVVIGVSLSLRWTAWEAGTPVVLVSDSEPAAVTAPPPAVAAKSEAQAEAAPRREDGTGAAAPTPAAAPVRARPVPAPAPAPVAAAPAQEEVRPPPPPAAPAPMAPPAPAPMALPAPAPAAPTVFYRSPPPPPAPAAPAPASAPSAQATPQASTHVEVTGSRIARSDQAAIEQRAEQWLSLLTELLDRHLDDDARDNWARFRREFPDYPVPPSLQARIDALQPTS